MRLWRGEPNHPHWKALITPRDKALALLVMALVSVVMAWAAVTYTTSFCGADGKLICSLIRHLARALGSSLALTEAALFGGFGALFALLGISQWRNR
jgi:hypothetical protein